MDGDKEAGIDGFGQPAQVFDRGVAAGVDLFESEAFVLAKGGKPVFRVFQVAGPHGPDAGDLVRPEAFCQNRQGAVGFGQNQKFVRIFDNLIREDSGLLLFNKAENFL